MKVLLVTNRYKKETTTVGQQIVERLKTRGLKVEIDDGKNSHEYHDRYFDRVIVVGGDGTILRAARNYARLEVPVLGVNMGTVGFLSSIEVYELDQYIDQFLGEQYGLEERLMLAVDIYNNGLGAVQGICLNEVVLRSTTPRMMSFDIDIAGESAGIFRGDGIIIATPTGSTAYSLSSGGPIVDPDLEAIIITPIASHIISKRPLVIKPDQDIVLRLKDCCESIICLDGQVKYPLEANQSVRITRAPYKFKLVNLKQNSFFSNIDARLRRSEGLF
ncbi:NAD(+)/NADH kinase [Syntrophomonas erecta]